VTSDDQQLESFTGAPEAYEQYVQTENFAAKIEKLETYLA
jgi:hypothetical protein